jgi:hypothetical protein
VPFGLSRRVPEITICATLVSRRIVDCARTGERRIKRNRAYACPIMATDARLASNFAGTHNIQVVQGDGARVACADVLGKKVFQEARGHAGIDFDRRYPAMVTNKSMQYCRVIADPGIDMHNLLPAFGAGLAISIIESALGDDADHDVVVEVHGISARGRLSPAHESPGAATEKILALDRCKGRLDAPVGQCEGRHDLPLIGAPDDFLLRVAIQ